ncbi:hypothetical protein [Bradyrhizobium sp.]|uniref:hypothetical protein n=1 Tax=Bradyrhizobium sp. TaxID=376 RepID=UPI002637C121|nr:hypothetical protein [Bradyrhizobium sp.]
MSERSSRRTFASRPADPETWIKTAESPSNRPGDASSFTARLTIDVTPELRGRIKIIAFKRGVTVAEMLRELLAREFPSSPGDTP